MKVIRAGKKPEFVFFDLNEQENEHDHVFKDLCKRMMYDDLMQPYRAEIDVVEKTAFFYTSTVERKACAHSGRSVRIVFQEEAAAMAFKLAYVSGEDYLPWTENSG